MEDAVVEALTRTSGRTPRSNGPPGGRSARWVVATVVIVAAGSLGAWLWLSAPHVEHGSQWGVSSTDHPLLDVQSYTGPDLAVVPADSEGTSTVVLGLRNAGRVPVTLVDVWPEADELPCGWGPTTRRIRTDPQVMYADAGPEAPLPGATIAPGDEVAVWLEGVMNDPDGCTNAALASIGSMPVVVEVLGRQSQVDVELEHARLGWTDNLETRADTDLTVLQPPG